MDYSFGIEQFNTLIDEIETAKQQEMLDVTGHDVEALHNKCEVLLKNVYPPNSEWGDVPFMHELYGLKTNQEGYNGFNRLSRLRNLADVVILDLRLKDQKAQKQADGSSEAIQNLKFQLENYRQVEENNQKIIAKLQKQLVDRTENLADSKSREIRQEVVETLASYEMVMNRLKRYLWISTFAVITVINLAIPFVLQRFNWIATAIVQVFITEIFLWMYFKCSRCKIYFWRF